MTTLQDLKHEYYTRVRSIVDPVLSNELFVSDQKDVFSRKAEQYIDDLLSGKISLDQSEETSLADETMQGKGAPMPNLDGATISGAEPREPDDVDDESEILF
jgi:hypothetical protein